MWAGLRQHPLFGSGFFRLLIFFKLFYFFFYGIWFYLPSGILLDWWDSHFSYSLPLSQGGLAFESPSFWLDSWTKPLNWLLIGLALYLWYHRSHIRWSTMSSKFWVRGLIVLPVLLLTYELVGSAYNHYWDHPFHFERILLILFALLAVYSPFFLLFFLGLSLQFQAQSYAPINGFPLVDKRLLFDLLILFIAYIVLRTRIKIHFRVYLLGVIVLVAGNYFSTGCAKILISSHGYEWLLSKLEYSMIHNCSRGWCLSPGLQSWIAKNSILIRTGLLTLELSALLLLWRRSIFYCLLGLFFLMHLGIYYVSGFLFWKWMVIDILLLIVVRMYPERRSLFTNINIQRSLIAIPLAFLWLSPYRLAWFDSPMNQRLIYEAELERGKRVLLFSEHLSPYENHFKRGKFFYLIDEEILPIIGFGYAFNHDVIKALEKNDTLLINQYCKNHYDIAKKERFISFIKKYFSHYNKAAKRRFIWEKIPVPSHAQTNNNHDAKLPWGRVKMVRVYFITENIQQLVSQEVRRKLIHEIKIP